MIVRKGLVIAQVALSLVLLTGAGLFLRSLGNLKRIDLGFRADHLMSFAIQPSLNGYDTRRAIALFDAVRQRVAAAAGRARGSIDADAVAGQRQLGFQRYGSRLYAERRRERAQRGRRQRRIFRGAGDAAGRGARLPRIGRQAAPRVAVVNETFARVYFEGANPIGRQFYFSSDEKKTPIEIVGVAKDGKYADVREEKQRFVFTPYAQQYNRSIGAMFYYVRTAQDPESIASALRQTVHEADANLPVFDLKTMDRQIDEDMFADRIVSLLSAFFGVLATALAAIGLYGVMSYTVTRRTREIGIRMALGAGRGEVLGLVMREVAILAAIGIAIAAAAIVPAGEPGEIDALWRGATRCDGAGGRGRGVGGNGFGCGLFSGGARGAGGSAGGAAERLVRFRAIGLRPVDAPKAQVGWSRCARS